MKDSVNVRDAVDSGKSNAGAYLHQDAYGDKAFAKSVADSGSATGVVPEAVVSDQGIVFGAPDRGGAPKDRQEQEPDHAQNSHKSGRTVVGSSSDSVAAPDKKDPVAKSGTGDGAQDKGHGPLLDSVGPQSDFDSTRDGMERGLKSRGGNGLAGGSLDQEPLLKF
ncbi:MAG: hypothetical protein EKK48_13290 [Candidatus Melainabacteria bacterium]|nr:MAG: hypothetical protein EKK48_13290 [Candidatus Melainabacteria bacterium]